jgi:hypothetical protein
MRTQQVVSQNQSSLLDALFELEQARSQKKKIAIWDRAFKLARQQPWKVQRLLELGVVLNKEAQELLDDIIIRLQKARLN